MSELEYIGHHIHVRISSLQRMLDLSVVELPRNKIKKVGQELCALEGLLEEFEKCVGQQKERLTHLKELEDSFVMDLEDVQHIMDNIPAHIPRKKGPDKERGKEKERQHWWMRECEPFYSESEAVMTQNEAVDVQPVQLDDVKKSNKTAVREMAFITMSEFESIPQYMKGRATYGQLNAVVQSINTSVTAKYKILRQSLKSLNSNARKLHQRFRNQETKDTKGQYFVVEDDIREFTQLKVDKRFQGILNMLRHCQRLRELRGGGITRYMLL
ncbi:SKA complex subunit 1 isoform X1 [Sparus aurata]|nr:spindle and kinetochore-associated protein 1 isoform X1 [Sparus aurata]